METFGRDHGCLYPHGFDPFAHGHKHPHDDDEHDEHEHDGDDDHDHPHEGPHDPHDDES